MLLMGGDFLLAVAVMRKHYYRSYMTLKLRQNEAFGSEKM
jgi:hypothetical protein